MKLPILQYGDPVLRKQCEDITADYPRLDQLIDNLFETMQKARGCGLAASQTGLPIRLFVVDSKSTFDQLDTTDRVLYFAPGDNGIVETFSTARMIQHEYDHTEGVLILDHLKPFQKKMLESKLKKIMRKKR